MAALLSQKSWIMVTSGEIRDLINWATQTSITQRVRCILRFSGEFALHECRQHAFPIFIRCSSNAVGLIQIKGK